jgi:hypothetical protein
MNRNFLVLAVLALAAVALTTADASAWGWWRYRSCHGPLFARLGAHHANRPYNAFTPTCMSCNSGGHGLRAHGWRHHGAAPACSTCMAGAMMQGDMAQYVDPSLLPYMAQAAPMPMPMPMQMQMPIQPASYQSYQEPYGVQPVNYYMPAYYPAYQPYPYYYYPMQPAMPYNGYGYGYGY